MPKEVLEFFKQGGEQTALDTTDVLTRNWLWSQIAGSAAYVGDNRQWIKELWKEKFYLQRLEHKSGTRWYIMFKGNQRLRETLTAARYGTTHPKVIAITSGAGSAQGLRHAAWEGVKGTAQKGGVLALLFTIALDAAEWLLDYEQRDPQTGQPKKDIFDLFFKIGIDVAKAGISAAIGSVAMGRAVWTGCIAMFQGPFPLGLRLSAVVWVVCLGMTSGFMYMLNDEYGASAWLWKIALAMALGMSVLLLLASVICKTAPSSVLCRMFFAGTMVVLPIVTLASATGLSYLAAVPESVRPWLWFLMLGMTALWCLISLNGYKQRVIDRRFIEREFSIEETRIVVRQPLKTDLDPKPISEHTFFGRLYHRFGPYLVFGIPLAYPAQRLVTDTAGGGATLLLLAVFGFPLMLYIVGRMTCGAYLWIYKVWQMQRRMGKPVVFDEVRAA